MPVDEQTLLKVLLRGRSKVIAYIWCILRDSHSAEDIFQDVCLIALRKREEILGPEQVLPWLRSVARHKAMKVLATRSRRPVALNEEALGDLELEWARTDPAASAEMADALERCVGKLNEKARRLIELRYGSQRKAHEIAEDLSVRANSVYRALSRIHLLLLQCIKAQLATTERPGHV